MNSHWNSYGAFTIENYGCYWTLSNLKSLKEKLYLLQLKACSTKWNRCGAFRLNVSKLQILSCLLNWTSGGHKNSEQSVHEALQIFSSSSDTRSVDRPGCKINQEILASQECFISETLQSLPGFLKERPLEHMYQSYLGCLLEVQSPWLHATYLNQNRCGYSLYICL